MASSIIHLAIAKQIKEKSNLKIDNLKDYYLGSIAPDIAKQVGTSHNESHFIYNTPTDIPNLKLFVKRYPIFKYNSFDLGYFTHLYVDKNWIETVLENIVLNSSIKLLDGTTIQTTPEEIKNMIYSDYTNLNIKIIEDYNLDLSLFYEDFKIPKTNIKEIPIEKLDILINKMGIIIENSKENKAYSFDIDIIKEFIDKISNEIIEELEKY